MVRRNQLHHLSVKEWQALSLCLRLRMRMQAIFIRNGARDCKERSQIAALQEDIKTIDVTKQEAETFMSNIEKLI